MTKRIPLAPGIIRAWTVGNGISGPMCLQLAVGTDQDSGFEMFVFPNLSQWELADKASWLASYKGWCPVDGCRFLDLVAAYVVPANQDWAGSP
jgi:hypothetical protein